jgi:hypothetical protein
MLNNLSLLAIGFMLLAVVCPASADPPTYRILRRHAAPARHHRPGQPEAVMVDSRTSGYAYGYFGVAPRSHASRHFGNYRTYTQWSTW